MINIQFTKEEAERVYDDLLSDLDSVVTWDWDVREDLLRYPGKAFDPPEGFHVAPIQSAASKLREAISSDASQPSKSVDGAKHGIEECPVCGMFNGVHSETCQFATADSTVTDQRKESIMDMADPRPREQKKEDFLKDKKDKKEFRKNKQQIIDMIEELIAVNQLEYHNKDWLAGDNKSRCEAIGATLADIKTALHNLKNR